MTIILWITAIALGVVLVFFGWIAWVTKAPGRGVLGSTDVSYQVASGLAWSADNSRLFFEELDGDAGVVLIRRSPGAGTDELWVEITGNPLASHRVDELLKSFGLRYRGAPESSRRAVLSGELPTFENAGRLLNSLLRASGMADGARYGYRFEGKYDGEEIRRYIRRLRARNKAIREQM